MISIKFYLGFFHFFEYTIIDFTEDCTEVKHFFLP